MGKKSNHKHEYEYVPLETPKWFTHEQKCTICGHVHNKVRIEQEEDTMDHARENLGYGFCASCNRALVGKDRGLLCSKCDRDADKALAELAKPLQYHAVQFEHNDIPNTSFYVSTLTKEEFKTAWREHKEYLEEAEGYDYKSFTVWAEEQGLLIKEVEDIIHHDPYEEGYY